MRYGRVQNRYTVWIRDYRRFKKNLITLHYASCTKGGSEFHILKNKHFNTERGLHISSDQELNINYYLPDSSQSITVKCICWSSRCAVALPLHKPCLQLCSSSMMHVCDIFYFYTVLTDWYCFSTDYGSFVAKRCDYIFSSCTVHQIVRKCNQ